MKLYVKSLTYIYAENFQNKAVINFTYVLIVFGIEFSAVWSPVY